MTTQKDTHKRVLGSNQTYSGDVFASSLETSEIVKTSDNENIVYKKFDVGAGNEDCMDINRGKNMIVKDGIFHADGATQAITCKGGHDGLTIKNVTFNGKPSMAHVVLGQYSDHNMCADLKVKNTEFINCKFGKKKFFSIICWYAERPTFKNCKGNTRVLMIPKIIVNIYFGFRKWQQRREFGPEGRGGCCNQYK